MKFSKRKMMMCAALLPVLFSLVGCKKDPNQIDVVFVPSRDPVALGESAKKLEPVLDKIMKDNNLPYFFKINKSTTYSAAGTALMNSQADVGFLTGTSYAQMTVDHPGSVDLLLTAQRSGFKVQTTDYKNPNNTEEGRHKQVQAMNGETMIINILLSKMLSMSLTPTTQSLFLTEITRKMVLLLKSSTSMI